VISALIRTAFAAAALGLCCLFAYSAVSRLFEHAESGWSSDLGELTGGPTYGVPEPSPVCPWCGRRLTVCACDPDEAP